VGGTYKRLPSEIVVGTRQRAGANLPLLNLRQQFVNDLQASRGAPWKAKDFRYI
jgi:hypothetical protein